MLSNPSDEGLALPPAFVTPSTDAAPRRFTISLSQRTLWLAAGVALATLVLVLVVTRAFDAVLLIFFAIILAEAIRPLVLRLERRRVPRPLGALLIYLVVAALLFAIGWLLFTPLVAQISAFIQSLPAYLAEARQWAQDMQQALAGHDPLTALIDGLAAQLTASLQAALPSLL